MLKISRSICSQNMMPDAQRYKNINELHQFEEKKQPNGCF
jgi:hypothetical protein